MEIAEVLTCECKGYPFTYANKTTYKQHKTNKQHIQWEMHKEVFELRCMRQKLENEVSTLKKQLSHYIYWYEESQKRVQELCNLIYNNSNKNEESVS